MSFIFSTNRHILINSESLLKTNQPNQADQDSMAVALVFMIERVDRCRIFLSVVFNAIQGELVKAATLFRIPFVM